MAYAIGRPGHGGELGFLTVVDPDAIESKVVQRIETGESFEPVLGGILPNRSNTPFAGAEIDQATNLVLARIDELIAERTYVNDLVPNRVDAELIAELSILRLQIQANSP